MDARDGDLVEYPREIAGHPIEVVRNVRRARAALAGVVPQEHIEFRLKPRQESVPRAGVHRQAVEQADHLAVAGAEQLPMDGMLIERERAGAAWLRNCIHRTALS